METGITQKDWRELFEKVRTQEAMQLTDNEITVWTAIRKARTRDAKRRSGFNLAEKNKADAKALRKRACYIPGCTNRAFPSTLKTVFGYNADLCHEHEGLAT